MKSLCIYCGSSLGTSPIYAQAARRLGGRATGVIPEALLQKELGHKGLTQLHIVKDMHERNAF